MRKRICLSGRPQLEPDVEALIVRVAPKNPRLGCDKIQGKLLKLDLRLSPSTLPNVALSVVGDVLGGILHNYYRDAA
jgi:hypothetical protein